MGCVVTRARASLWGIVALGLMVRAAVAAPPEYNPVGVIVADHVKTFTTKDVDQKLVQQMADSRVGEPVVREALQRRHLPAAGLRTPRWHVGHLIMAQERRRRVQVVHLQQALLESLQLLLFARCQVTAHGYLPSSRWYHFGA